VTQRTSGGLEPGGWGLGPERRRALHHREERSSDRATRERLIASAARLFGERGFKRVTVREICRAARANVAAVNYHFGDKLGLYREVLQAAVTEMRATSDAARRAGEGGTPEDKLRAYIGVYIRRVVGSAHDSWIHQLMSRELADPTPALDLVVQQVIRPRLAYLSGLVAELLDCSVEDQRVARCAHGIQAQCVALIPNPLAARLYPDVKTTPAALAAFAEHIAEFSLAGIHALRRSPGRRGRPL
jgi:TetR/AcrR family transcriptional regulator, regulator of cefoperazone and chloramphenicol sensitivity